MAKRKVILTPIEGKKTDALSATTDSEGKFCFQVQPGAYRVQVGWSQRYYRHFTWFIQV